MKRILSILCVIFPSLLLVSAHAQMLQTIVNFGPPRVLSYIGPGDKFSGAAGWWGFRAYNAAYAAAGGNAIILCTPADAACETETVGANGKLVLGTVGATCNNVSTICTIKELFDQSGNSANCTQATIASRPTFVVNDVSSLPGMHFGGSAFYACSPTVVTASSPATTIAQIISLPNVSTVYTIAGWGPFPRGNGLERFLTMNSTGPIWCVGLDGSCPGTLTATTSPASLAAGYDGSNLQFNLNGTTASTSVGSLNTSSGNFFIGATPPGNVQPLTGDLGEVGLWNSYNATNIANVISNMQGFW